MIQIGRTHIYFFVDNVWMVGPSFLNDKYNWTFYLGFLTISVWRSKK